VQAESDEKKSARRQSAAAAPLVVARLLRLNDYPGAPDRAAFYTHSALLVDFLVRRQNADQFLSFVERSQQDGYDRALRDVYGLDGVTGLQIELEQRNSPAPCAKPTAR
jgi:hypothetical protein